MIAASSAAGAPREWRFWIVWTSARRHSRGRSIARVGHLGWRPWKTYSLAQRRDVTNSIATPPATLRNPQSVVLPGVAEDRFRPPPQTSVRAGHGTEISTRRVLREPADIACSSRPVAHLDDSYRPCLDVGQQAESAPNEVPLRTSTHACVSGSDGGAAGLPLARSVVRYAVGTGVRQGWSLGRTQRLMLSPVIHPVI